MMSTSPLATSTTIANTVAGLTERNYHPVVVDTKAEALSRITSLIPAGATIMNGASQTLEQIGFLELLKSKNHAWLNLHDGILTETDPAKQAILRKQSVISDFYLGSVHALTEQGEMVIASNTGSQLPHLAYTSPNIILVVGAQKIVPDLAAAFKRLTEVVIPLEDARIHQTYGSHTTQAKTMIMHREAPTSKRQVHVMIVNEALGF